MLSLDFNNKYPAFQVRFMYLNEELFEKILLKINGEDYSGFNQILTKPTRLALKNSFLDKEENYYRLCKAAIKASQTIFLEQLFKPWAKLIPESPESIDFAYLHKVFLPKLINLAAISEKTEIVNYLLCFYDINANKNTIFDIIFRSNDSTVSIIYALVCAFASTSVNHPQPRENYLNQVFSQFKSHIDSIKQYPKKEHLKLIFNEVCQNFLDACMKCGEFDILFKLLEQLPEQLLYTRLLFYASSLDLKVLIQDLSDMCLLENNTKQIIIICGLIRGGNINSFKQHFSLFNKHFYDIKIENIYEQKGDLLYYATSEDQEEIVRFLLEDSKNTHFEVSKLTLSLWFALLIAINNNNEIIIELIFDFFYQNISNEKGFQEIFSNGLKTALIKDKIFAFNTILNIGIDKIPPDTFVELMINFIPNSFSEFVKKKKFLISILFREWKQLNINYQSLLMAHIVLVAEKSNQTHFVSSLLDILKKDDFSTALKAFPQIAEQLQQVLLKYNNSKKSNSALTNNEKINFWLQQSSIDLNHSKIKQEIVFNEQDKNYSFIFLEIKLMKTGFIKTFSTKGFYANCIFAVIQNTEDRISFSIKPMAWLMSEKELSTNVKQFTDLAKKILVELKIKTVTTIQMNSQSLFTSDHIEDSNTTTEKKKIKPTDKTKTSKHADKTHAIREKIANRRKIVSKQKTNNNNDFIAMHSAVDGIQTGTTNMLETDNMDKNKTTETKIAVASNSFIKNTIESPIAQLWGKRIFNISHNGIEPDDALNLECGSFFKANKL